MNGKCRIRKGLRLRLMNSVRLGRRLTRGRLNDDKFICLLSSYLVY